jgi:hypothetical protein
LWIREAETCILPRSFDFGRTLRPAAVGVGMPETEAAPSSGGKLDATRIVIVLIAAVAVLVGGFAAVRLGRGVEASLGNFKFVVQRGDSFSDILNEALKGERREEAVSILAGKGFYQVTDRQLVAKIEALDPGDPAAAQVAAGLRQMLWNLSGPFRRPDTLTHAKVEMIAAIEDQIATADDPERGKLVAELVKRSLDRSGMFEVRRFAARLEPLPPTGAAEPGPPAIFTCPGSEMIGKQVQIWGAGQTIFGEVEPDVRLTDRCQDAARTIQQLLQGKAGVFGIAPEAHSVLTGPPPPGASPNPSFVLNPVDLAPQLFTRG